MARQIKKQPNHIVISELAKEADTMFPGLDFRTEWSYSYPKDPCSYTLYHNGHVVNLKIGVCFNKMWNFPRYYAEICNNEHSWGWGKIYFWQRLNKSLPIVLSRLKNFVHTKLLLLHEDLSQF